MSDKRKIFNDLFGLNKESNSSNPIQSVPTAPVIS